jgi:hypothetical protein
MSVRGLLSLCLYHMGDYVCEVAFRKDIRLMWWHRMYGKLMLMSHRLDKHDEVWNTPEDGMLMPKHLRDDDEPLSEV